MTKSVRISRTTGGLAARASFRCGLAALEAILLLLIVAAGLSLLAGQMESWRGRLRQDLASRQLAMLSEALTVYYLDCGTFPAGQTDLSSGDAFRSLRALPATGPLLTDWPTVAEPMPAHEPADPWRCRYRYVAVENDRSGQVADNGGWPFFVSAGPDGGFGEMINPTTEIDNRRTNELPAAR